MIFTGSNIREALYMGKILGEYIKGIRKEKNSVKLIAESSEISKSYIDYIESGLRNPLQKC
jgi:transcriptional regulator with XRE-family HTH domain